MFMFCVLHLLTCESVVFNLYLLVANRKASIIQRLAGVVGHCADTVKKEPSDADQYEVPMQRRPHSMVAMVASRLASDTIAPMVTDLRTPWQRCACMSSPACVLYGPIEPYGPNGHYR